MGLINKFTNEYICFQNLILKSGRLETTFNN